MKTPDFVKIDYIQVNTDNKKGKKSEETETTRTKSKKSKKVKPTLTTEVSRTSSAKVSTNSVVLSFGKGVLLTVQFSKNCRPKSC